MEVPVSLFFEYDFLISLHQGYWSFYIDYTVNVIFILNHDIPGSSEVIY